MENKKRLNLAYIEDNFKGDENLIVNMLVVFKEQVQKFMEEMNRLMNSKDWDSWSMLAHKMLPSVTIMGIKELEEMLVKIDEHVMAKIPLDELPAIVTTVLNICTDLLEEIEAEKQKRAA